MDIWVGKWVYHALPYLSIDRSIGLSIYRSIYLALSIYIYVWQTFLSSPASRSYPLRTF
jgi:hypothetical protein